MYYLRYKMFSLENAMLEKHGDKSSLLAWYRANWQVIVFAQLWSVTNGFEYTIR